MTSISDLVLVESKSVRSERMERISHDRATEILDKVKGLFFFLWQGTGSTTTESIADFYEVSVDTVQKAIQRHRDEFESDGLRTVKGKDLKALRSTALDTLSIPESATVLTVWTPRSALRLGMLLRDSVIGKEVRTSVLDLVEHTIPTQQADLERMRLENENLRLQVELSNSKKDLAASVGMLAAINSTLPILLFADPNQVVHVPERVETSVMVDQQGQPIAQYDGLSITYIAKKYGFGTGRKATDRCKDWLTSIGVTEDKWVEEPTAHMTRKLPRDLLPYLDRHFASRQGERQRFIGE